MEPDHRRCGDAVQDSLRPISAIASSSSARARRRRAIGQQPLGGPDREGGRLGPHLLQRPRLLALDPFHRLLGPALQRRLELTAVAFGLSLDLHLRLPDDLLRLILARSQPALGSASRLCASSRSRFAASSSARTLAACPSSAPNTVRVKGL